MSDDAEFDAFLKGDGDLSRRLQDVPQAVPSAALDAAILQRARELMAQESSRPAAANDAGTKQPAPRLGWRWRVPAGIAATVLAGVFARQAYQASADREREAAMPQAADDSALIMPAPAPMQPPTIELTAPAPKPMARAPVRNKPIAAAAPPPPPSVAEQKPAPTSKAMADHAAPAPAPAPAPVAAPAPEFLSQTMEKPTTQADSGILARTDISSNRTRSAAQPRMPAEWLAAIEAMLAAGKDTQAANEWRSFRQANPDYPVPQTTQERIKAIAH